MLLPNYSFSFKDLSVSILTGISGLPFAKKHWDLAKTNPKDAFAHRVIAVLEAIPVIGGLCALIEKVIACSLAYFLPRHRQVPLKPPLPLPIVALRAAPTDDTIPSPVVVFRALAPPIQELGEVGQISPLGAPAPIEPVVPPRAPSPRARSPVAAIGALDEVVLPELPALALVTSSTRAPCSNQSMSRRVTEFFSLFSPSLSAPSHEEIRQFFSELFTFLSNKSSWQSCLMQDSDIQRIYLESHTRETLDFQTALFTLANDFEDVIPQIEELISTFLLTFSSEQSSFCHGNEALLFYVFSPLLNALPLKKETAENILKLLISHELFSCSMGKDLIKKCIQTCSDFPERNQLIFSALKRSFKSPPKPFSDRTIGKISEVDSDLFEWFLSNSPSRQNLITIFFGLITHTLLSDDPFNKGYCKELLGRIITNYPQILNEHQPSSYDSSELSLIQICLLICDRNSHNLKCKLLKIGCYSFHHNLQISDADCDFFQDLLIKVHCQVHPRYSPQQVHLLEKIFPKDSPGWNYLNSEGLFEKSLPSLLDLSSQTSEQIQGALRRMTFLLRANLTKGNSSPYRIDFDLVLECRHFKMQLKGIDKSSFAPDYDAFVKMYDQIIDHIPFLSLIRKMSREVRVLIRDRSLSPSVALAKYFVFWSGERKYEYSYHEVRDLIRTHSDSDSLQLTIRVSRLKMIEIAKRHFANPFWQTHPSSHMTIHGSKIGALHLIMKNPPEERALRATGDLLLRGVVPLTGELCGSHVGWNSTKISFTTSSLSLEDRVWSEDPTALIFFSPSSFCQSVVYATKQSNSHGSNPTLAFRLEDTWQSVTISQLTSLLANESDPSYRQAISFFVLKILRLRMTDPEAPLKLKPFLDYIEERRKATENPELGQQFINALTKHLPLILSPHEVALVQQSVPVIFASTSHYPSSLKEHYREILLPTELKLGALRDIPAIFTWDEHISELREMLRETDIEICSIEELFFIETLNMIEGSAIQTLQIDRISDANLHPTIERAIKEFASPHYAKLLPSLPIAPKEASSDLRIGHQEVISGPFFGHPHGDSHASYLAALEENPAMPSRHFHGVMHMLRTALFSQVFYTIFNPRSTPKERYLVALAGAYHDSARQDEGRDRWDELSAWNLRRFLRNHNQIQLNSERPTPPTISESEISECYEALACKDPKGGVFTSAIQKAVHDADCIEINRCLTSPLEFDASRLVSKEILRPEELGALVSEMQRFIRETETLSVKSRYEYDYSSPYLELVNYLLDDANGYHLVSHYFRNSGKA